MQRKRAPGAATVAPGVNAGQPVPSQGMPRPAPIQDDALIDWAQSYRRRLPCKADGSDPAELKARIFLPIKSVESGFCKFLDAQPESNRLEAHALCQFPDGPLIGDFTFTRKTNGTIDFVDRDGTYAAILYRCSR